MARPISSGSAVAAYATPPPKSERTCSVGEARFTRSRETSAICIGEAETHHGFERDQRIKEKEARCDELAVKWLHYEKRAGVQRAHFGLRAWLHFGLRAWLHICDCVTERVPC
eukprot:3121997-Pleurochrysis_carterae.AAC.1